jgi:ATP-dependent Zn protease
MTSPTTSPEEALRATAYHEAGHAVANLVQGLTVDRVSIIPGEGFNGRCRSPGALGYRFSNARQRRAIGRAIIVACYGGIEAERFIDPGAPEYHADDDMAIALEQSRLLEVFPRYMRRVGDEWHMAYLERLRGEARRLVKRHRAAVAALAEELLCREELDGAQVEELLSGFLST